jgi:hypothetical protein
VAIEKNDLVDRLPVGVASSERCPSSVANFMRGVLETDKSGRFGGAGTVRDPHPPPEIMRNQMANLPPLPAAPMLCASHRVERIPPLS